MPRTLEQGLYTTAWITTTGTTGTTYADGRHRREAMRRLAVQPPTAWITTTGTGTTTNRQDAIPLVLGNEHALRHETTYAGGSFIGPLQPRWTPVVSDNALPPEPVLKEPPLRTRGADAEDFLHTGLWLDEQDRADCTLLTRDEIANMFVVYVRRNAADEITRCEPAMIVEDSSMGRRFFVDLLETGEGCFVFACDVFFVPWPEPVKLRAAPAFQPTPELAVELPF